MTTEDEQVMKTARIELEKFADELVRTYWKDASYHRAYHQYLIEGYTPDIAETKAVENQ